jgi:hypothetical protein
MLRDDSASGRNPVTGHHRDKGHACAHCAAQATEDQPPPAPIELPDAPNAIRVHTPGKPPQDCTLHPDGTLTMVINGQLYRSALTFADMLAMNWTASRIEMDPRPLEDADEGSGPASTRVQEALPLGVAQ